MESSMAGTKCPDLMVASSREQITKKEEDKDSSIKKTLMAALKKVLTKMEVYMACTRDTRSMDPLKRATIKMVSATDSTKNNKLMVHMKRASTTKMERGMELLKFTQTQKTTLKAATRTVSNTASSR